MEFWLLQNKDKLQLPVPPSEFEVSVGNMNETIVVENVGEVNLLGKGLLLFLYHHFFLLKYMTFVSIQISPNHTNVLL